MNTMLKDRIYGSLYGFAIGDAMGATTEFMDRTEIKKKYGTLIDIIGGGWLNLPAGQVTDDTQMMLCVARAILKCYTKADTLEQCCKEFKDWLATDPVDVGNACRVAISTATGTDPNIWMSNSSFLQAKSDRQFLGNGGLMRCLAPCLIGDMELAIDQSRLTHNNRVCDVQIAQYYHRVRRILEEGTTGSPIEELMEPEGHVVNTYNNAVYWTQVSKDFEQAIIGAVNDGEDADTIAALTGGLAGALHGYDAIPARWIAALDGSVVQELREVAEYICARCQEHE